ncbi:MAG TPA: PAS-domain containing protein, partial [Stellaceae bacterium]|nr:PAS-domain containing protein [Stellaceae bacterium]
MSQSDSSARLTGPALAPALLRAPLAWARSAFASLGQRTLLLPLLAAAVAAVIVGAYAVVSFEISKSRTRSFLEAELRHSAVPLHNLLLELEVLTLTAGTAAESSAASSAERLSALGDDPMVASIAVFDAEGRLSTQTAAMAWPDSARQALLATAGASTSVELGAPFQSAGGTFAALALAVRNPEGSLEGYVAVAFPLREIRDWLASANLPDGAQFLVLDRAGQVWLGDAPEAALGRGTHVALGWRGLELAAGLRPGAQWRVWWRESGGSLGVLALLALLAVAAIGYLARLRHREGFEREAAVAALAASERRIRELTDVSQNWQWETDAEHRYTHFAGRLARVIELPGGIPLGRTRLDLIHGTFEPTALEEHMRILERREPFRDFIFALRDRFGRAWWTKSSGSPIVAPDGSFAGYRGTASDVTAEIESALRAHAAERQLVEAVESSPWAFALFDQEDRLVLCNTRFRDMFGGVKDDLAVRGRTFEEIARSRMPGVSIVDTDGDDETWMARRLAYHRNPSGSFEVRQRDGRWFQIIEQKTADGRTASIFIDITPLKEREDALRKSEEQFRVAFDAAPIGMAIIGPDMRYLRANAALCQ